MKNFACVNKALDVSVTYLVFFFLEMYNIVKPTLQWRSLFCECNLATDVAHYKVRERQPRWMVTTNAFPAFLLSNKVIQWSFDFTDLDFTYKFDFTFFSWETNFLLQKQFQLNLRILRRLKFQFYVFFLEKNAIFEEKNYPKTRLFGFFLEKICSTKLGSFFCHMLIYKLAFVFSFKC